MSAIDRVKELLAAAECNTQSRRTIALSQLSALAIPFAEELVALAEHADVHDRDCCQQLARLSGLAKAMDVVE